MRKIEVFTVDSDVPMPHKVLPPISQLKVGESILFPLEQRPSVQTIASKAKKDTGKKFSVKKVDEASARVWRVE